MGVRVVEWVLDSLTADPSSPPDGCGWHRSDLAEFRIRLGGVTKSIQVVPPACTVIEETADETEISATDVQVGGTTPMTVTPAAGTYLVSFEGSVSHSSSNADMHMSIYSAGSQVAASEREAKRGAGQGDVTIPFKCSAKVTVNGSQAIEGMWRTSTSTATMYERQLTILKVS